MNVVLHRERYSATRIAELERLAPPPDRTKACHLKNPISLCQRAYDAYSRLALNPLTETNVSQYVTCNDGARRRMHVIRFSDAEGNVTAGWLALQSKTMPYEVIFRYMVRPSDPVRGSVEDDERLTARMHEDLADTWASLEERNAEFIGRMRSHKRSYEPDAMDDRVQLFWDSIHPYRHFKFLSSIFYEDCNDLFTRRGDLIFVTERISVIGSIHSDEYEKTLLLGPTTPIVDRVCGAEDHDHSHVTWEVLVQYVPQEDSMGRWQIRGNWPIRHAHMPTSKILSHLVTNEYVRDFTAFSLKLSTVAKCIIRWWRLSKAARHRAWLPIEGKGYKRAKTHFAGSI